MILVAYFYILASWLALWFVFYGWGVLAARISRCQRNDLTSVLISPWVGMSIVLGVLQIWHLFLPVGTWAFNIVFTVGLLSAALLGAKALPEIVEVVRRNPGATGIAVFICLWLVNRALNDQEYADQGLYYLNAIRWERSYAIVPGLGNLHDRLGFNNSVFLLHAMLESLVGRPYTAHVVNGFISALAVPIIIGGFRMIFRPSADERQLGWLTLAMAMIVSYCAFDHRISSAAPCFPAAMFVTVAAWRLLSLATIPAESKGGLLRWNLLVIAVLATAAVTVKTTVIFFAGAAAVPLVVCLYRLNCNTQSSPFVAVAKQLLFMAIWFAVLFVPWVIRGYVLSGYPLFPSTIGGVAFDWQVPQESVKATRDGITVWARAVDPRKSYKPGLGWIPDWVVQIALLRGAVEVLIPALISFACICWLVWRWLRAPPEVRCESNDGLPRLVAILLAVAYALAVLLWFSTAPNPRMGSFACWGLAAILIALVSRDLYEVSIRYRYIIVAGLAVLLMMRMLDLSARIETRYRTNRLLTEFYGTHFYNHFPFTLDTTIDGFPPVPKGDVEPQQTKQGVELYLPKARGDEFPGLLWDSPLPASEDFNPNLAYRQPGDLSGGFKAITPPGEKPWIREDVSNSPQ